MTVQQKQWRAANHSLMLINNVQCQYSRAVVVMTRGEKLARI